MFSLFLLISPLIISFLFLRVFKKAGFEGGFLAISFTPVLGAVLPIGLMILIQSGLLDTVFSSNQFDFGVPVFMIFSLIGALLGLLPAIILAFVAWPNLSR